MRKFYTLLSREVRSYFYSPIAYVVLVFFLLLSGVDFYFQLSFMNGKPVGYSVQEAFFNSIFFWFAFVLIFPLITMRLFSEEFKLGTIEPLMTAPVRDWQVILSKFFGALVFYLVLWIPTLLYFVIFQLVTHQPAATSSGAYLGSYLMLLLLGMFYISVGCLASVMTKNQIVAAIISFCVITHAVLPRAGFVHPARCQFHDPTVARLLLRDRADGHALARGDRYPADGSLHQHDGRDAGLDPSGVPIAEVEVVTTMATTETTPPPTEGPRKIQRVRIGLNVLVQLALILFLAAMVNYLGFEHYKRWDLSRDKKYALSDKSKRFLDTIKGKMRLTVFFDPNNPIGQDVQNLLTQYQYAAKGKIDVENIDPTRSLSRAKEVFDKYKVVSDESLVIVDYEGRNKTVKASEMAEIDQGNADVRRRAQSRRIQRRASDHQRDDGLGGRKEECRRLRARTQGAADRRRSADDVRIDVAAGGRAQPDLGPEDVYREREHQAPGAQSFRSAGHSAGAQDDHDRRPAV